MSGNIISHLIFTNQRIWNDPLLIHQYPAILTIQRSWLVLRTSVPPERCRFIEPDRRSRGSSGLMVRTVVRLLGMRTEIDGRESIPPSSEITLAISPYRPRIRVSEVHSAEKLCREVLVRASSSILPAAQVTLLALWFAMETVGLFITFIFLKVSSFIRFSFPVIAYVSYNSLINDVVCNPFNRA